MKNALGLIETVGMAAAIEAADAAVKSANVTLIGIELTKGDGMVTVKLQGDVGAVKAAIESAKHAASLVNRVYATKVIPRPAEGIDKIVFSKETKGWKPEVTAESPAVEPVVEPEVEPALPEEKVTTALEEEVTPQAEAMVTTEAEASQAVEEDLKEPTSETGPDASRPGVCNYCQDPECPRRKGDPRDWCKHA